VPSDPHPHERFAFCPSCGAPREGERSARLRCGGCGFVYYFNPAPAVAAFVRRDDGRVLFIRREKQPSAGMLAPPGGFVDIGETPEQALCRELREEVNAELDDVVYLCSAPNSYTYGGLTYPVIDLFYVARVVDASALGAHDAVESLCWLDPMQVDPDELAFPSMQHAMRRYVDGLRDRD
jgi:ADP-ribose pyrophosphatase YjhB (NUDIX family)